MAKLKVGILISGRGSNMAALLDACQEQRWNARIEAVVSDREHAPACRCAPQPSSTGYGSDADDGV